MFKKITLIVLTNYEEFSSSWGINAKPILNNGNYLLPLGWEEELTKRGIDFEIKEVDFFEEIIEEF